MPLFEQIPSDPYTSILNPAALANPLVSFQILLKVQPCSQRHMVEDRSLLARVCLHAVVKAPCMLRGILCVVTGDVRVRNQDCPVREILSVQHGKHLRVPGRVDGRRGAQVGGTGLERRAEERVRGRRLQVGRDGRGVLCGGQFIPGGRVVESARGRRVGVGETGLDDGGEKVVAVGGLVGEDAVEVLQMGSVARVGAAPDGPSRRRSPGLESYIDRDRV